MKHNYIIVSLNEYNKYLEINRTNRLDKYNRIISNTSCIPKFHRINEEVIGDKETTYSINKENENIIITFETNSGNKYRFDLLKDPIDMLYHLAFSDNYSNNDNYELPTNRNESIEIFSRLSWILKDFSKTSNIQSYCIGGTSDERKNKIYQYMLRFIENWEKKETEQYDLGWGIYFDL